MLTLKHITTLDELRSLAAAWDDLWRRSDADWPTLRAELMAQWIEQFAAQCRFHALVVEDDGVAVAALPTLNQRLAHCVPVVRLPGNAWSPVGDLLLDPACDIGPVLDLVARGIAELSRPLVSCDSVCLETPRWQSLLAALARAGMAFHTRPRGPVGQVQIGSSWASYQAALSRNHRRQLRVAEKRALAEGGVELVLHSNPSPDALPDLLKRGFAVEDRGWKGQAGSSVLRSPGMFEFYLRQACQLAAWGKLELAYLEHRGEPIAFEFGWRSKQTYYSLKVGYDEAFAKLTPGQLLRAKMLERFHTGGECRLVDYVGPLTDATARWTTQTYTMSRLVIATGGPLSRWLLQAMCDYGPRWRDKIRSFRREPVEVPEGIAAAQASLTVFH